MASAPIPTARTAAHDPIRAALGDNVNKHFRGAIVNSEGNDGFADRRDRTQARSDFIARAALVDVAFSVAMAVTVLLGFRAATSGPV